MKQFFGAFFGSILGMVITTLLVVWIVVSMIKSSIKKEMDEEVTVSSGPVLKISINGAINERDLEDPFEELRKMGNDSEEEGNGLSSMVKKIKYAAKDDDIKGIYIEITDVSGGFASITELRNALSEFKKSGKFIYCYAENYGQAEYYLASVASKVFLNPQGSLEFKGLSMSLMFYKNTFEKLGVEMQVFRHGKYKSAIEPFLLDKMSEANRAQSESFLNSIWSTLLQDIAQDRKVNVEELNKIANELTVEDPESAVNAHLIDAAAYEDEVLQDLKRKAGIESEKIKCTALGDYKARDNTGAEAGKNKIAVIYANGSIEGGEGDDNTIGSDRIARAIKAARLDEKVKAIVFRVNSPGGSALASDIIWREVTLAKKSKPFIVSMGNYAASGGYYISCAADHIFAQPNTITGSIGVFGLIPNVQKALSDKLGITVDTVNTNKYSNMGNAVMPLREKEKEFIQASVEKVYDTFISRVAEGRGMDKSAVDSIGQGRVWSGKEAMDIKLVDELGGLQEAIAYAAKKAKVGDYKVLELPRPKNPLDRFLGKSTEDAEAKILERHFGITYTYIRQLQNILRFKGVQARLPFDLLFE